MAKPTDNLTLDVMDAQRMGYGCHYGHFKADHPNTAFANESRLAGKPARQPRTPLVYEKVCIYCGRRFLANNKSRKYCGDDCKKNNEAMKYRKKKENQETGGAAND